MSELVLFQRRGFEAILNVAAEVWPGRWEHCLQPRTDGLAETTRVVVVCCDHPDAYRSLAHTLKKTCPLAEVLVAAGPWLQAFGRTRSHWPAAWLRTESETVTRLRHLATEPLAQEPRPWTWTRDERWLHETAS